MGNRDKHLLTQLDTIAKGLSETLAPFCEVVVHDLTNPEHAILSIHNNLSGRSVHDKFHRTLILSGFCLLKIAKISLNSSFFPKPIKR
ncbi:hypothetical protein GH751_07830 [Acinetobacter baumannii]|nr:hypothetical protein [Acinetobacter baumannii]